MRHIQTDILVIGGGATGTGIARDLAMRGLKCILVERRDLTYGTTGRYHGLLHSGGRYVVKDPQAAKECIEENRILRHIMPQCIEDTGGFFVQTPWDDSSYAPRFVEGCHLAGISVEDVPICQMLIEEPLLNPNITQCFRVPDASADSFLAADLNAESARQHGAVICTYHEVIRLVTTQRFPKGNPTVCGAICHDLIKDEDVQIDAGLVVNASGAWVGIIANTIGIDIQMVPGKGTMVAINHRVVNTVINRCKLPSDGDILVPAHTVAVMGTTDIKVSDPDHYSIEPWEIRLMLNEGEKIIPGFKSFRLFRAWAGVRPLFQEIAGNDNRNITRAFVILDHAERDGVDGFISVTSGKWTTYRKMAEITVDKVCEKLRVDRHCRTHLEELPSKGEKLSYHHLGARLDQIEKKAAYGLLICECELATIQDIEGAIIDSNARTLDDIRRDVRLGMGPCQGAFCTYRAAGMLHNLRHPPVLETNVALRDFLQERWKGNLPILWGQQLRQERLNELIYLDVLNTYQLPGQKSSRLTSETYTSPEEETISILQINQPVAPLPPPSTNNLQKDTIIIGAGLSGLITGWRTSIGGKKTHIIAKGWGATYWGSGCIDVFGYHPSDLSKAIDSPISFLEKFIASDPQHPYALVGLERIAKAIKAFQTLCEESNYPLQGSLESNWLLPTALGTLRPTCLAPDMMIAGDAHQRSPVLVVGFNHYLDFFPSIIADNLNAQHIFASDIMLDLISLGNRKFVTSMVLAHLFDTPEFRHEVINALKPKLGRVARVGFPAVLGLQHPTQVKQHLESSLGIPVFEIPGLPPSIPGIRLHNLLVSAIERNHGHIFNGMQVIGASSENKQITAIWSEAASRQKSHQSKTFVLATGGILGGGVVAKENGYAQDTVFGIQVAVPDQRTRWFVNEFLSSDSQPIHKTGLRVDQAFRPIDQTDQLFYDNLYAVGGALDGFDPIREHSLEGIALATGFSVGEILSNM